MRTAGDVQLFWPSAMTTATTATTATAMMMRAHEWKLPSPSPASSHRHRVHCYSSSHHRNFFDPDYCAGFVSTGPAAAAAAAATTSTKRARTATTLLRMADPRRQSDSDGDSDGDSDSDGDNAKSDGRNRDTDRIGDRENRTRRRRRRDPPKLSFLDKLIDKSLLLDTDTSSSSPGAGYVSPPLPTIGLLLLLLLAVTIATSLTILPNTAGRLWFAGLFGLFSFLSVDPIGQLQLLEDRTTTTTTTERTIPVEQYDDDDNDNDDDDNSEFPTTSIYGFAFAYFAALTLAGILAPLDFEMATGGTVTATDAPPSVLATAIAAIAAITAAALSNPIVLLMDLSVTAREVLTGRYDSERARKNDGKIYDDADDDRGAVSLSSEEKRLMDLWDREFEREQNEKPDRLDD